MSSILKEFYTSSSTNIKDAQGQDALVSLVGTIGTGLTWSGSIFVNPLIARTKHVQLIMLSGVFIMSLGIFLASFSTMVRHGLTDQPPGLSTSVAVASVSHASVALRHWGFAILFPSVVAHTGLLRCPSWFRTGADPVRRRSRRSHPLTSDEHLDFSPWNRLGPPNFGPLESCRRNPCLVRGEEERQRLCVRT